MSFVSIQFLIFVAAAVGLFYAAPKKYRWYELTAASVCFYILSAGWLAFAAALVEVLAAYASALLITRAAEDRKKRKLILSVAVILLVTALTLMKLKSYFTDELAWLIAPLGVSYYSFSLIGYLADVYYKKEDAEKNFLKLILYSFYFPKIIQGPISKFREIGPRLTQEHCFDYTRFCFGLQLIVFGYFKKIVIADRAALLTQTVFGDLAAYDGGGMILAVVTVIAVIRHYCDFSGYMDIVIGISQLFGVELEENFKQPFFSRSAAEFWRRWHITLGVWFKDYVYMPLVIHPKVIRFSAFVKKHCGKRAGKAVLSVIPLGVTWILTGLWHGTGVNYLLWGVYWGTIIILSNVFAPELKRLTKALRIKTESFWWRLFQSLRTFAIFTGGLLISTLVGIDGLRLYFWNFLHYFRTTALLRGRLFEFGLNRSNFLTLLVSIAFLFVVEVYQQKGSVRERIAQKPALVRWLAYAFAFVMVVFLGVYGGNFDLSGFAYAHF